MMMGWMQCDQIWQNFSSLWQNFDSLFLYGKMLSLLWKI